MPWAVSRARTSRTITMLQRTLATLALALLASPALGQAVGTPMPRTNLQGFTHTEATSLDDFYGRAILLEFFAYW